LALRHEGRERMTQDGSVIGTPAYLAPEVARGERDKWGPATDQYALGVVLYELLTGQTPFAGPMEVVLFLHQTREPDRPSRRNKSVPRDLEAVCLKCLEKDPSQRYPTTADLARDLTRFLAGEPVIAGRQSLAHRLGKRLRKHRRMAAAAAAAFVL